MLIIGALITIALLLLWGWWLLIRRRRVMSLLNRMGIPGPKPNLIWGNLTDCFSIDNVLWDSYLIKKYGKVVGYYLGAKPIIVTSDPSLMKRIQSSVQFLERPRRVPGGISPDPKRKKMLANLNVQDWKEVRKVLTPGFTPSKLKLMLPQISSLVKTFLHKVKEYSNSSLDFYPLFQGLTLDLIGRTGFGVDSNIQTNLEDPLHLAIQEEFSKSPSSYIVRLHLAIPELSFFLHPLRLFFHKVKLVLGWSHSSALWELGEKIVQQRLHSSPRPDLLQLLIQSHFVSSDPVKVVANSVLFFEAAYETVSSSLAFLVHFLVNHPNVQEKVREEIQNSLMSFDSYELGKEEELLNYYEFVQKLEYMEAVIKEALRILPPQTTFISRCGSESMEYVKEDGTSLTIPKGVHIQLALFQLHRSEDHWKEPEVFRPERFLEDEGAEAQKNGAYQAFGSGLRSCIGERYSFLIIKLILANLLFNFQLNPCPQTEDKVTLKFKTATMTPLKGSFACPILINN